MAMNNKKDQEKKVPSFEKETWKPKTSLGRMVKADKIKTMDEILEKGYKILEPEIVDCLLPNLESDLISFGQSKGKFGGGKKSIWRQTQKKTKEGNKPRFSALAVVGTNDGYIGIGRGKAKETVPAREKAVRRAKLNIIKIKKGCGSWEGDPRGDNSIPFKVRGKCGSVIIELIPAPLGSDLKVEEECRKMLSLAGIRDLYSKTYGKTKTKINLIYACFNALKQLTQIKTNEGLNKK